jgi:hypothetical protein
MPLDSDIANADSHLHVEFYMYDKAPYKDTPFVRIMVPGDKTNIIEQPARDYHKERFIRQWLHFQSQNSDGMVVGTKLEQWHKDKPEEFNDHQMAELQILKFQTVEQVATATDAQLQRIGMGAAGLRERARAYLMQKNQSDSNSELAKTRSELDELKAQMAMLMSQRKPGRPRKEDVDVQYDDASVGATGHQ